MKISNIIHPLRILAAAKRLQKAKRNVMYLEKRWKRNPGAEGLQKSLRNACHELGNARLLYEFFTS